MPLHLGKSSSFPIQTDGVQEPRHGFHIVGGLVQTILRLYQKALPKQGEADGCDQQLLYLPPRGRCQC